LSDYRLDLSGRSTYSNSCSVIQFIILCFTFTYPVFRNVSFFGIKRGEMAGKSRQKSAANVVENVTLSLNERILKDCHALYTDSENGENLQSKPRQIIISLHSYTRYER